MKHRVIFNRSQCCYRSSFLSNARPLCYPTNEKKPVYNNHYKTLPSKEMGKKLKATMHENKCLPDYTL